MSSSLILSRPELNPDVFFGDTSKWNIGTDWTVFLNSAPGAICTAGSGTTLDLAASPLRYSTKYKYKVYVESCDGNNTFLLIGGNIIPIPLDLTPQVYEGEVTTASNVNAVSFISSSGDNATFNYLKITESPESYEIDLTDDIDVPLTYSVADIKDPSARKAAFSKTVTIPGTKNNNRYFTHIFEISGDGTFNPNKKVRAVVLEDGIELFNGICQLKTINRELNGVNNYNLISYEIVLLGKLADLFYLLGDTLLSDLDFSEYDHVYDVTNQRDSWYTQIQKNGANYTNTVNGSNLTITSCANNAGRVQVNFSAAHGLVAGDWLLVPDVSLTAGSEFYYGEHEVYSVVSSTSVILRCPFDTLGGTTLTSTNGANGSVRKHTKKGEGYVYPMCNYGAVTGNTWKVGNFYPAVYLKEYIDKIFKKIGFVYDSSFFDETMFKKLIIPFNGVELKMTQDQIDAKKFRASSTAAVTGSYLMSPSFYNVGTYGNFRYTGHANTGYGPNTGSGWPPFANTAPTVLDVPVNDDSTLPNYDIGGTFNTSTYRWTCPVTGSYDLSLQGTMNHKYTVPGGAYQITIINSTPPPPLYNIAIGTGVSPGMGYARVEIYDYTTNTVVSSQSNIQLSQNGVIAVNVNLFSFPCVAGNQYGVRVLITTTAKGQFYTVSPSPANTDYYTGDITVTYEMLANAVFKNAITNTTLQDGDTLQMNICVPQKIKCKDLLMSVIKLFNLYVQPDTDNDKKLYIETRNGFYATGDTIDWTDKIDIGQKLQIIPMGELNSKAYEFKYAEDKAVFGADHKAKYGIGYGDYKYTVDNDYIPDGTNTTEVIFSASVLSEVQQGAGSGRIISETNTDNLRLLYFNMSSTVNQIPNNTWTHSGLTGTFSRRIFPYAGHLDKVEAPNFDLNWSYPRGVYFDYDSWTSRGLVNQHYKQMLDEITDKNSRLIKGYFKLNARDIFALDFRNLFIVDGHFLRLNKVGDYLVNKNITVLCEFLKVENKAPFVPTPYVTAVSEEPVYNPTARTINGTGNPEVANETNGSNSARLGITINGEGNIVNSYGSRIITVSGDNNNIAAFSTNVLIQGDSNTVEAGLTNVALINTSGVTVTESNTIYVNGIKINSGAILPAADNETDLGLAVDLGTGFGLRWKNLNLSGYVGVGNMATFDRDNLTASNGMIIYNTDTNKFEGYENGVWTNLI